MKNNKKLNHLMQMQNTSIESLFDKNVSKETKDINESSALRINNKQEVLYPKSIYKILDREVIGQEKAKRALSFAICNHVNRSRNPKIPKANVLIAGPSGTGKTAMCELLTSNLDLPFVNYDATNLTTTGYTGSSVEDIFKLLLVNCDYDLKKAQSAVVFIDEIDKKALRSENSGEIGTVAVQSSLLKIIEGSTVSVKVKDKTYNIKTHNMLFICAGAFSGISYGKKTFVSKVGLNSNQVVEKQGSIVKDLINFGMLNEFIGRFSIITQTEELKRDEYLRILKTPLNSNIYGQISSYQEFGIELKFTDDFYEKIVEESMNEKTGVRGLNEKISNVTSSILFDLDHDVKRVVLKSKGYTINNGRKIYEY